MDVTAALDALAAAGTEQTRKTYRRHGAPEPMFGTSFAVVRALAKQAGVDHDLAAALWATGNTDARCLATLVADPARLDEATADAWASGTGYHLIVDLVADLVARSPLAIDRMAQWVASSDEYVARCGWTVMACLAREQRDIADAAFTPYLAVIERKIGDAANRTRQGMNTALIAIGGRSDELAGPAIAAAQRIGVVEVDHGDTACVTAEAVAYIGKMRARANAKAAPRPSKKQAAPAAAKKKAAPAAKKKKKAAPATKSRR